VNIVVVVFHVQHGIHFIVIENIIVGVLLKGYLSGRRKRL